MADRLACPSSRCAGTVEVLASGTLDGSNPVELGQCGSCGRVVEVAGSGDPAPTLFDQEAGR